MLITTQDAVHEVAEKIIRAPEFGIDFETTGLNYKTDQTHGIALAVDTQGWYVTGDEAINAIVPALQQAAGWSTFVGHNLSYDLHFMWRYDIRPAKIADTMIAQFLVDENQNLGLKQLAETKLGYEDLPTFKDLLREAKVNTGKRKLSEVNIHDIPVEKVGEYAAKDAVLTLELWKKSRYELAEQGFTDYFWNVKMPFVQLLTDMEDAGFLLNFDLLAELKEDFTNTKNAALDRFYGLAGKEINLNSPKQLQQFFFETLGLKPVGYTPSGSPSVDALALLRLKKDDPTGAAEALANYRTVDKLLGTYVTAFEEKTVDGYLYGHFNQLGDSTDESGGRLPRSGRLCVDGDTLLETSRGIFCIRDYKPIVGDSITTHTGLPQRILNKYFKGQEMMYEVITQDGRKITTTAGHRFFTPDGWKHLRDIRVGDLTLVDPRPRMVTLGQQLPGGLQEDFSRTRLCSPVRIWENDCEGDSRNSRNYLARNFGLLTVLQTEVRGTDSEYPVQSTQPNNEKQQAMRDSKRHQEVYTFREVTTTCRSAYNAARHGRQTWRSSSNNTEEPSCLRTSSPKQDGTKHLCNEAYKGNADAGCAISWGGQYNYEHSTRSLSSIQRSVLLFYRANKAAVLHKETRSMAQQGGGEQATPEDTHFVEQQSSGNRAIIGLTGRQHPTHSSTDTDHGQRKNLYSRLLLPGFQPYSGSERINTQASASATTGQTEVRRATTQRLQSASGRQQEGYEKCVVGNTEYTAIPVASITPVGVRDVWDIEVENDHSYVAHGFINHNSSSSPNLQNIPARGNYGAQVRDLFIAPPGFVIVVCDYSQLELRIIAHYTRDDNLLKVFAENGDPHQLTADLCGVPRNPVAKSLNFGVAYGAGPNKLAETIEKTGAPRPSQKEAKGYLDTFTNAYPKIISWKAQVVDYARQLGYVKTLAGRKRRLPDLYDRDKSLRSRAERQAVNTIIQGGAADVIEYAMLAIDPIKNQYGARLQGQVHDELIYRVPENVADEFARLVSDEMVKAGDYFKLRCPLVAEPGIGPSWNSAKH